MLPGKTRGPKPRETSVSAQRKNPFVFRQKGFVQKRPCRARPPGRPGRTGRTHHFPRERNTEKSAFCRKTKDAFFLEAPPRFELGNRGFAVLCLTTWLWRHITYAGERPAYEFCGAGNEARTRYLHLGKVALYRMSYARKRPADCGVVPPVGVEPTTRGFSVRCSTY